MKHHEKARTIRYEILKGSFFLTGMIVLIVAASILCLYFVRNGYSRATECQQQQYEAQKVITAHYKWLEHLSAAITSGDVFEVSRMATETAGTFGKDEIEEITCASQNQQTCMTDIRDEISRISSIVAENAASSEQTAAAMQEMNASAEFIRGEMQRFQLRKREPGKPYIPPEKAGDTEFIRIAEKNYLEAAAKGRTPKSLPGRTESEAV